MSEQRCTNQLKLNFPHVSLKHHITQFEEWAQVGVPWWPSGLGRYSTAQEVCNWNLGFRQQMFFKFLLKICYVAFADIPSLGSAQHVKNKEYSNCIVLHRSLCDHRDLHGPFSVKEIAYLHQIREEKRGGPTTPSLLSKGVGTSVTEVDFKGINMF